MDTDAEWSELERCGLSCALLLFEASIVIEVGR